MARGGETTKKKLETEGNQRGEEEKGKEHKVTEKKRILRELQRKSVRNEN